MAMDQKPIIIAIVNESFSDISVLGDFESDPYLSNWYAEDSYVMRGYVYSSVYGGGTSNSEFEFLTGNSMVNCTASTYPYESYDLSDATNIVEYLKDTQGYDTLAFHPYGPENWNRPVVYNDFGFNTYLCWDDMEDPQYVSWAISDESDYEFASLLTDLEQREEPIIVCLFGDHQPSLNEEFLNTVTVQDGENEGAQNQKLQMTPYMIWANYDTGIEQTEQVGGVNEYND